MTTNEGWFVIIDQSLNHKKLEMSEKGIIEFEGKRINFYHRKARNKPVLVFLHGFCEDLHLWKEYIDGLVKYEIVLIDLPGFGKSEVIEGAGMAMMATVVKAVVDSLDLGKFFLIGHSMGGYVGLEFAKKYEDDLKGFVLFHSHPFAEDEAMVANRKKSVSFIKRNYSAIFVKQLFPNLFHPKFLSSNHHRVDMLILRASRFSDEGIINALEAMSIRDDNSATLAKIKVPVCFIMGEEETIIPKAFNAGQVVLPDVADVHLLPNVNHMGMFEAEKQTQKIIKKFVARNKG